MSGMRASAQTPPELSAIRVARSAARCALNGGSHSVFMRLAMLLHRTHRSASEASVRMS